MARNLLHTTGTAPDPKMLEMLICPLTHAVLHYDEKKNELVSRASGLAFPIRDGIPIMLESEARKLSASERDQA